MPLQDRLLLMLTAFIIEHGDNYWNRDLNFKLNCDSLRDGSSSESTHSLQCRRGCDRMTRHHGPKLSKAAATLASSKSSTKAKKRPERFWQHISTACISGC